MQEMSEMEESDKTPAGFPVITQGPGTRVIEVGHTVQMQCKAIGNPPPTIYWIINQTKVDMTNPRYVINNARPTDQSPTAGPDPDTAPQPEAELRIGPVCGSRFNNSKRVGHRGGIVSPLLLMATRPQKTTNQSEFCSRLLLPSACAAQAGGLLFCD
ncbi:hypothetical protein AWZ03_008241 [Drosophila navojoa]|uniref:Ig-like domain-containing protein n=1 Tax=Drosophila navojoa TaxID=7232 RepID=A0A484BBF5_DRONA|nr:hypothetical protein AWZ03_008241 [Drosophila navojoa]